MTAQSVLLVEDDPSTRERLRRTVQAVADLTVLAAVADCAGARAAWATAAPAIVLVDLALPDGDGVELIRELGRVWPQARSMVITVFGDEAHVVSAICAGASGYLLKDASDREIGEAILQILGGGAPISPGIAHHLLRQVRERGTVLPEAADAASTLKLKLTAREQDVLEQIAAGGSYAEIADALGVSINTVRTHIRNLYDKLAVNSRGKLVPLAEREGLLRWPRGRR